MRALAAVASWRPMRRGVEVHEPLDCPELASAGALPELESGTVLERYGVPVAPRVRTATSEAAVQAAERLGFPVVVKVDGPAHKAIAGGVVLGVTDAAAVADATVRLGGSVLVAKQVPAGIETFCGMTRDPDYGPIVAVGLGGRAIEALSLAAVALAPIGWERARALVAEAPGLARLATPVALDQLATIAVAVSRLAVEHPEVQAIDVNPVILSDADAVAVDALIHVAP